MGLAPGGSTLGLVGGCPGLHARTSVHHSRLGPRVVLSCELLTHPFGWPESSTSSHRGLDLGPKVEGRAIGQQPPGGSAEAVRWARKADEPCRVPQGGLCPLAERSRPGVGLPPAVGLTFTDSRNEHSGASSGVGRSTPGPPHSRASALAAVACRGLGWNCV